MKLHQYVSIVAVIACLATPALGQSLPGEWNWGVGGGVTVIFADGTGNDGHGNTMRWTLVDPVARRYRLAWSHGYTDDAALSADGTSLSIVNNTGTRFTSVRRAAAAAPGTPEQGGGSTAAWTSLRPNSDLQALRPLGETGFRPGRYFVLVADADPDGRTVRTWKTHGPFEIGPGDHWIVTATPSSGLGLEKGKTMTGVGTQRAAISARNIDTASWQAVCVLPEGRPPRPTCFAGSGSVHDAEASPPVTPVPSAPPATKSPPVPTVTFSRWKAITPHPGQSIAQPGRVMPLEVVGDSHFRVGRYQVFVADAGPHGLAISSWNTFGPMEFKGRERWAAVLQPGARVRLDRNGADVATYPEPDIDHAMIWARNDDGGTWLAICVLPVGMPVSPNCFGGNVRIAQTQTVRKRLCEGTLEFRNPETKNPIVAQMRFTIEGRKIAGALSMRARSAAIERSIEAKLSGTIEAEKITGRLEGRSDGRPVATGGAWAPGLGALAAGTVTFPFSGDWAGTLKGAAASGTHLVDRGDPKSVKGYWFGGWKATCH